MLRQLSVFAGGWTLQAAADVAQTADEYDALALLTALHDKSLLVVDREVAGGRPRYRMLETVRQYALRPPRTSAAKARPRGAGTWPTTSRWPKRPSRTCAGPSRTRGWAASSRSTRTWSRR